MSEQARRELILEVADRLLRHYGPQKTTMADVAREANVGVGSVYLDFPSKDALIEELSRRHYRSVLSAMRRASEEEATGAPSAADRLVRVLDARAAGFLAMRDNGAHACDLLHCGSDAVKAAQSGYHEDERGIFTEVLQAGKASGELAFGEIEVTLRILLLAYSAFAPPWIFKLDRERLGVDLAAMHELVLRGLMRRDAGPAAAAARPRSPAARRRGR